MWVVITVAWGAPPPANPCHDTASCQEAEAARYRRFAAMVAKEPAATRLPLTRVGWSVLADRAAGLVYVVDPDGLAALDLNTGAEQWRIPVSGDTLDRAGELLVVTGTDPTAIQVALVDPAAPAAAQRCTIPLVLPPGTEPAMAAAFDRRGVPHLWWQSWWSQQRGTPTEHLAWQDRLVDCGVIEIGPDCAAKERPLRAFVWKDPDRQVRRFPERCARITPLGALPAAAASAPPTDKGSPAIRLEIPLARTSRCPALPPVTLVVEGPRPWRHRILDERPGPCIPETLPR